MSENIIIGVVGLFGSGKDTVAEYLVKQGFVHYSFSDILREELKKKGLEENISNLAALGNETREKYGFGELAKRTLKKIKGKKTVISSIRHISEIEELKKGGNFFLIAVEAPIELRYQRVKSRARLGDNIDFEKFKAAENKQLSGAGPQQQLLSCLKIADQTIINDKGLDNLYQKIDQLISKLT